MTLKLISSVLLMMALAGCAVGPDFVRTQLEAQVPADWTPRPTMT